MSFTCSDKETLITYIYGECDRETQASVESHMATCASCADEVAEFGGLRATLARWTPPEQSGSFRIVRDEADGSAPVRTGTVLRPARWWQAPVPVWARAAAAILLVAGAAALANIEVRYDKDGFVVRTGWGRPAAAPQATQAQAAAPAVTPQVVPAAASTAPSSEAWRAELASVTRQLREEIRQVSNVQNALSVSAPAQGARGVTVAQVRAMVDETAQRQQAEFADRLSQITAAMVLGGRPLNVQRVSVPVAQPDSRTRSVNWVPADTFGGPIKK